MEQTKQHSLRLGVFNQAARLIEDELYYWGCDTKDHTNNLLVRFGLEKFPHPRREGSSIYELRRSQGARLMLHSFCAAVSRREAGTLLFIRAENGFFYSVWHHPPLPGEYGPLYLNDAVNENECVHCRALLAELLQFMRDYESWIESMFGAGYRRECRNGAVRKIIKPERMQQELGALTSFCRGEAHSRPARAQTPNWLPGKF